MTPKAEGDRLSDFLAAHKPVATGASIAVGDSFDDWRVTAFLGRGGSGEVYRVENLTLGTAAALKVCARVADRDDARDAAVCSRFRREAKLLAENKHPAFPCFRGFGEREGRPWYVMELLEHRPLPATEREIARFLLAVASGVQHLHSQGIIHRDIKPGNILWRNSSPVLIDLGLAKDLSAVRGHVGETLSVVDGKAMGVGTPRYAAPEQMAGGDVSLATDVYALGMLANDCFGGKPPRTWQRIIQRATAAIPTQRYATADVFARAINFLRMRYWIYGTLVVMLAVLVIALWTLSPSAIVTGPLMKEAKSEKSAWRSLCRNITTNIVSQYSEMRRLDDVRRMSSDEHMMMRANTPRFDVALRTVTNKINAAMVNLGGRTVVFSEPINLDVGREYWIVGPGVLDAQFSASSTVTVHLVNCIFRNRTKTSPRRAGINYVLDGGAYLNFTDLPATRAMKFEADEHIRNNGMSEGRRWWRVKGPEDIAEVMDEDENSSAYSPNMKSF